MLPPAALHNVPGRGFDTPALAISSSRATVAIRTAVYFVKLNIMWLCLLN